VNERQIALCGTIPAKEWSESSGKTWQQRRQDLHARQAAR